MNEVPDIGNVPVTIPEFLNKTTVLAEILKKKSVAELARLLKINTTLAQLNFERYQQWSMEGHEGTGCPAIFFYQGEVFRGLDVKSFDEESLYFTQSHLRILSGFYGVLRPLDRVLPYRLEMGGLFSPEGYRNLYEFWKNAITKGVEEALVAQGDRVLINLASNEYFKSIDNKQLSVQIITPVFKEAKGDDFKMVTVYAKKARGMMARFIINNRLSNPDQLMFFDKEGYYYNESLSNTEEIVFTR